MNWLKKIFSGGADKIIGSVKDFAVAHTGKKELALELEKLVNDQFLAMEQSVQTELQAKERIIVAEMNQGDNYTRRARPTVVYFGLAAIAFDQLVRYIAHFTDNPIPLTMLPTEFWAAWGGVVSVWVLGRSAEKRGVTGAITAAITGSKKDRKSLLD